MGRAVDTTRFCRAVTAASSLKIVRMQNFTVSSEATGNATCSCPLPLKSSAFGNVPIDVSPGPATTVHPVTVAGSEASGLAGARVSSV